MTSTGRSANEPSQRFMGEQRESGQDRFISFVMPKGNRSRHFARHLKKSIQRNCNKESAAVDLCNTNQQANINRSKIASVN